MGRNVIGRGEIPASISKNFAGTQMEPDFLITTVSDNQLRPVSFKELYPLRDEITAMCMVWNYNSYMVDCERMGFIINGGRLRCLPRLSEFGGRKVVYARRNTKTVAVEDLSTTNESVSYILGLSYVIIESVRRELVLHISADGAKYEFKLER